MTMTQAAAQNRTSAHLKAYLAIHMRWLCVANALPIFLLPIPFHRVASGRTAGRRPVVSGRGPVGTATRTTYALDRVINMSKHALRPDYPHRACADHTMDAFARTFRFAAQGFMTAFGTIAQQGTRSRMGIC